MKHAADHQHENGADLHDLVRALLAEQAKLHEQLLELRSEVRRLGEPPAQAVSILSAASMLGCGSTRVKELLAQGKLRRAPRIGRKTMITVESIEALRAESRTKKLAPRPKAKPPVPELSSEEIEAAILRVPL